MEAHLISPAGELHSIGRRRRHGAETIARECMMATEAQGGFPQHEEDSEESTTGTTTGTTPGATTAGSDTTTGDGHPPRVGA